MTLDSSDAMFEVYLDEFGATQNFIPMMWGGDGWHEYLTPTPHPVNCIRQRLNMQIEVVHV